MLAIFSIRARERHLPCLSSAGGSAASFPSRTFSEIRTMALRSRRSGVASWHSTGSEAHRTYQFSCRKISKDVLSDSAIRGEAQSE